MAESESRNTPAAAETRTCGRCHGRAIYWQSAIIPGDTLAPPGSNRAFAHSQPAWVCLDCGYLEPHERRTGSGHDDHHIWRP